MTRDELRALADWLDRQLPYDAHRAAAFLRQIADEQPVAGAVLDELGVALIPRGTEKHWCEKHGTKPLYTLPLED